MSEPWWNRLPLEALNTRQWEALCDGCGQCCLHTLEDEDSGAYARTAVHCRYLDPDSCRCRDYENRQRNVPSCLVLRPDTVSAFNWLPESCAYRIRAQGRPLPDWHPLVSDDPHSVRRAGVSVHGRVLSEEDVPQEALEDYILHWID